MQRSQRDRLTTCYFMYLEARSRAVTFLSRALNLKLSISDSKAKYFGLAKIIFPEVSILEYC